MAGEEVIDIMVDESFTKGFVGNIIVGVADIEHFVYLNDLSSRLNTLHCSVL